MIKVLLLMASMAYLPAADDMRPVPVRKPTMWIVRFESDRFKREYLIPVWVAKLYHLKPGSTISDETARLIAIELGAVYPPEILRRLEELGD